MTCRTVLIATALVLIASSSTQARHGGRSHDGYDAYGHHDRAYFFEHRHRRYPWHFRHDLTHHRHGEDYYGHGFRHRHGGDDRFGFEHR